MKGRSFLCLFWPLILLIFLLCPRPGYPYKAKIAVFNFNILNLDARGYDATVTNMLLNCLQSSPSLNILNRKELEAFLSLNDLQQNDDLSNVVHIGKRLGLDMIIVGNVNKSGPVIEIMCKIAKIGEKSFIYDKKLRSFGDSGLKNEIRKLSLDIGKVMELNIGKPQLPSPKKDILEAPVNIASRPGDSKISLQWEDTADSKSAGYKIFRSQSEGGPFVKVAQVPCREYVDRGLERNAGYYYKIKTFDTRGRESDFSRTIRAETAITPNPPIILSTEGHVRSVKITWSPNPIKSGDPSKLMGYKLYRAKTEEGPYEEVANLLGKNLGVGIDTTLTKLSKVHHLDKDLVDGEEYYYKVSVYNERDLESDPSSHMAGRCTPVVQGVSAEGDIIRQIRLSWDSATSKHVKGYFIYRSILRDRGFTRIERISGRKTNIFLDNQGLRDEATYYYRVSLFEDHEKEGSMSDVAWATTKGPPPIPQGLRAASRLAREVRLAWNVSTEEEVKGYRLYRSQVREGKYVPIGKITGRQRNQYHDKGTSSQPLTDNGTYFYKLTAYNKVDVESKPSEVVSATTKPQPVSPSGLGGESLWVKEIPLFWQPNPEKDIRRYYILRSSDENEGFSEIARVAGKTSYVDRGLKDGWQYRYKIRAEDTDGLLSDFSETITLSTKPKPRTPEGLNVVHKEEEVILTWSANTEPDIVSYHVFEKGILGLRKIATVKEPRFVTVGPKPGRRKEYVVRAVDEDGLESEPSGPITVSGK